MTKQHDKPSWPPKFTEPDMSHKKSKIKRPIYWWNTLFIGQKESVIYLNMVLSLFDLF